MVSTNEIAVESAPAAQTEVLNNEVVVAPEDDFEKAQKKISIRKEEFIIK